uniref:Uncharacterized protein n=1 Tax=Daphnia galeata TaxID=27404 RepID=A0A8J2WK51_9CRUS|nr:unnamed protein product [Daphnia galeata]
MPAYVKVNRTPVEVLLEIFIINWLLHIKNGLKIEESVTLELQYRQFSNFEVVELIGTNANAS